MEKLNIQFFADNSVDEEEKEELDEELDNEEDVDDENIEETEDSEEETEEENEEETEESEDKPNEEVKKKQTPEENEYFKRLRLRSKELKEQKKDGTYEEGRIKGLIEAVNGINPFTEEKIEDEADVQEYLKMKGLKEKGLDPILDYHKVIKDQEREKLKEEKSKKEQDRFFEDDIRQFAENNPDIDIVEVIGDNEFANFADKFVGKVPLQDIWESYKSFKNQYEKKVVQETQEKVKKAKARMKSSVSLGRNGDTQSDDIATMTDKQFEQYLKKIKESF